MNTFLRSAAGISGGTIKEMSPEAMEYLMNYNWPGNIRELENIVERCVVITESNVIDADSLPQEILSYNGQSEGSSSSSRVSSDSSEPLLNSAIDDREKEVIIKALKEHDGNKTKTALALGISRRSLHRKIQKYEIMES